MIQQAVKARCRLPKACEEADLSLRTYRRWLKNGEVVADKRPMAERPAPANKLSDEERQAIVTVCNEPKYASLPPSQIVPTLLDEARYLASEATFYRVLHAENQLHHRGRSQAPKKSSKPTSFTAHGPNEVYTWDITYLPSTTRGQFYYLYLIEDIFDRAVVGFEVHENESGELASKLVQRTLFREQSWGKTLVLHSDNGAPMKSQTLKAKMEELGILASYSRPRVSNDNPFVESLFRTLKYRPQWPSNGFASLKEAREWVQAFVTWYNEEHKHSQLNFVTPAERRAGNDKEILEKRKKVLEAAKARNPNRWSQEIRNCEPLGSVELNPEKLDENKAVEKAA